ncbi:hypothetical protein G6F68_014386 [Rhizopus microsporus]|nr:hypothetical protein G6F68_014386 [Rhizopus microsporus]
METPAITIYTDSSDTGWGITSPVLKTHGFWKEEEKNWSINVRELMAIYFALKFHAPKFKNKTIKIFTDNKTSIKYTTKAGGTASPILQDIAVKIQDLCNQFCLKVAYQHVKGILNTEADSLSRKQPPLYERSLSKNIFRKIQMRWGPLTVDTFANRHNRKLHKYYSLRPDPEAQKLDALQQKWPKRIAYCYPPWKLIPRVLRLITYQRLE